MPRRNHHERSEPFTLSLPDDGIDWSTCLVPTCQDRATTRGTTTRDLRVSLPLCLIHLAVAFAQAERASHDPRMSETIGQAVAQRAEQVASLEQASKKAWLANTSGHMYFVRLNDLIKVGWTRDLPDRLKAYGASAEILVHYPATRDDETLLHRQLRPALAKGREWYTDGPIVQGFLTKALAQHGAPTITAVWTEPKQPIRKRSRVR